MLMQLEETYRKKCKVERFEELGIFNYIYNVYNIPHHSIRQ